MAKTKAKKGELTDDIEKLTEERFSRRGPAEELGPAPEDGEAAEPGRAELEGADGRGPRRARHEGEREALRGPEALRGEPHEGRGEVRAGRRRVPRPALRRRGGRRRVGG